MAAPMKLLLNRRLFQSNTVLTNVCREYRSKQKKLKPTITQTTSDPKQNVQYPYTPGDPLHEEDIQQKWNHQVQDHRQEKRPTKSVHNVKDFVNTNTNKFEKQNTDRNKQVSRYGHIYEKLKDGDLRLGRTILHAKSSMESKTILLEGQRLIRDAIALGAELKYLYFSTEDTLKDLPPSLLQDNQIFKIPYRDIKTWSDTTTPSGILGVFRKPEQGESYSSEGPRLPLTVILDSVKDPGNLGTLIRTAAAVGCEKILVLKGSANVWEGKVLRSGMGSHFAVPIYSGLTWSQVHGYIEDSARVFLADARTENDVVMGFDRTLSLEQVDDGVFRKPEQGESYSSEGPRLPLTVILDSVKDPGNLGTLIRTAAAVGCEKILVLKGSANVWEGKVLRSGMGSHFAVPIYSGLTWSQVHSYIEDSARVFLADARTENDVVIGFDRTLSSEQVDDVASTNSDTDSDSSSSDSETDDSPTDSYHAETLVQNEIYQHVSFPVISYSNVILHPSPNSGKEESVALVIGNECEGLSPSAKRFAYNCYGTFVTVPMNKAVDSLNTAVAGSIILYEIRRKMLDLIALQEKDGDLECDRK